MINLMIAEIATHNCPVLMVEDSDEDFEAFRRSWKKTGCKNPLYRCESGDEALNLLLNNDKYGDKNSYPTPCLILLDLNLPGTDGREVLAEIKQHNEIRKIPVVIFTTSDNPKDLETCYQNGANSYIIKPINTKRLMSTVKSLSEYWFGVNQSPLDVASRI